jgi:methyl-accepting chemotaxis protein
MLSKLSLRAKIQLLPALAGIAFIALIVVAVLRGQENTSRLEQVERGHFPALEASRDLVSLLEETQRTFQDATTAQDAEGLAKAKDVEARFLRRLDDLAASPVVADQGVDALRTAYGAYVEQATEAAAHLIEAANAAPVFPDGEGEAAPSVVDDAAALTAALERLTTAYNALQDDVRALSDAQRAEMTRAFGSARRTSTDATQATVIIGAVCLVALVLLSLWTMRSVVATLAEASGFVSAAAAEILAVARQTEANAADEAAFVDETRRTMDGLVESASSIATSASAVLERAELSASASRTIGARISELNAQALKITDVSDVIRGISDKSDILALNASLEGSRAGEAGRGFVLVGAEMRRLAETVMDAVKQIKQLANEIREVSQAAVLATEEGQKIAVETTQTSRQITLITSQQRTATEQVTQSVDEIQQFTRQAVNGAKQSRAAAADLLRTTGQLNLLLTGKQAPVANDATPSAGAA